MLGEVFERINDLFGLSVQFLDIVGALGGEMHGSVCIMNEICPSHIFRSLKQDRGVVTGWLAKNRTRNLTWFPHKVQCETRASVTTWI